MAITFDELIKNTPDDLSKLYEKERKVYDHNDGYIVYTFSVHTEDEYYKTADMSLKLSLKDNGDCLSFKVFNIINNEKIMKSPHLQKILLYLMASNGNTKIGRWVINPSNGDLYIDCHIPIEDNNKIKPAQITLMINALISTVINSYGDIRRILDTGVKHSMPKEDVMKNIIYELTIHNKLDLIPKLLEEQDLKKLCDIHQLILARDFEGASKIVQPENRRHETSLAALGF